MQKNAKSRFLWKKPPESSIKIVDARQTQAESGKQKREERHQQMQTNCSNEGKTDMIGLGSDHGGFHLKGVIKAHLEERGYAVKDYGIYEETAVDYPDIAEKVARAVAAGECERAFLFCGTGIGVCISANKVHGIRAAVCSDCYSAKLTREHNDANILCLGERVLGPELACMVADAYLDASFLGGKHERRVGKIMDIERRESEKE